MLVCKPWLDGEFGTTQYAAPGTNQPQTVVNQYGRQLLWAQAVAANEQPVTATLFNAKQATYNGIATQLQQTNPAVYSLFQGDQWTTRLEIGFEALFAAVAAGLLVLLIALTLIILKLGFLLLLVAGPFFLIIGIHPGFGRVVAIRWFEMLVGVLMKQVAVALTLSVLLYCYSLIMGTTDQVLPWALKIMMIALVTVAVFIYRKPFQHLFSSVGYGMLGAEERAKVSWRESAFGFRRVTAGAAGVVVPGHGRVPRVPLGAARHGGATGRATARRPDGGAVAAAGATVPEGMAGRARRGQPRQRQAVAGRRGGHRPDGAAAAAALTAAPPASGAPTAGWARGGAAGTGTGARRPAQPPVRHGGARPRSARARHPRRARGEREAAWPSGATRTRSGESSNGAAGGAGQPAAAPFWARSRRGPSSEGRAWN